MIVLHLDLIGNRDERGETES